MTMEQATSYIFLYSEKHIIIRCSHQTSRSSKCSSTHYTVFNILILAITIWYKISTVCGTGKTTFLTLFSLRGRCTTQQIVLKYFLPFFFVLLSCYKDRSRYQNGKSDKSSRPYGAHLRIMKWKKEAITFSPALVQKEARPHITRKLKYI